MNKGLERRIKRHVIAGEHEIFMAVTPGLEEAAEKEMKTLGLKTERAAEKGSLICRGKLDDLWLLALQARTISRLFLRVGSFKAQGFREFKEKLSRIPWELYLPARPHLECKITTRHCRLHVHDKVEKALRHVLSERFEQLPLFGETDQVLQRLMIRGLENRFTFSLDAGGGALYQRGIKYHVNQAPLKENIAAALLVLSGIDSNSLLIDPMCGSGSFTLEALGISSRLPPSPHKTFPFESWPSFTGPRYEWLKKNIMEKRKAPCVCLCSDRDAQSLKAAQKNLEFFEKLQGVKVKMEWRQRDFFTMPPPLAKKGEHPFLILNPPYGKRLPLKGKLNFFRKLGGYVENSYKGIPWGIITPRGECEKALGLQWKKKYLFKNGGLPVSFLLG